MTTLNQPSSGGLDVASTPAEPVQGPAAQPVGGHRIPPLIKRNTLLLSSSQGIAGIGNQMIPTLTAIMIEQLLHSAVLTGLGYSALGMSRFLVAYPLGLVSDRHGRKVALQIGLTTGVVGALGLATAQVFQSFPLFALTLIIFGLGVGAAQQLRLAAADMFPPSRRAEGLGYVLTGSLVGAMGGPVLIAAAQAAAPVLHLDPIAVAWGLVPLLLLPTMVLVSLVRPDPREIAANLARYYPGYAPRATAAAPPADRGLRSLFADRRRRVAYGASATAHGTMAMMMAMTPLSLAHHGHTLSEISLSVALHVIGMFAFSLPIGRLTDVLGRRRVMLVGLLVTAFGALLVPLTPDYWIATLGLFLVGLGWSGVNVSSTAMIADASGPLERGRAIGANDTFSGAASVVLPLLAGPLVALAGPPILAVVGVGLAIGPAWLVAASEETGPRRRRGVPA